MGLLFCRGGERCRPVGWQQRREVILIGHCGQTAEHVAQIEQRIDGAPAAGADDRVNDRGALASVGMSDEEPVLRADFVGRIAFSIRLVSSRVVSVAPNASLTR